MKVTKNTLNLKSDISGTEFLFRVWLYSEDDYSPRISVWCHHLDPDPTDFKSRPASEWVEEALGEMDLWDAFNLDRTKCWQILGKGRIRSWFDYWGEYDEEIDLIEFEKCEFEPEDHTRVLKGKANDGF